MATDPRITKYRVVMTNFSARNLDAEGKPVFDKYESVDYVPKDILDEYLAEVRKSWPIVVVSEEPDAGPLGYDGPTTIPPFIDAPNAGLYYPATSGSDAEKKLVKSGDIAAIATEGSDVPVLLSAVLIAARAAAEAEDDAKDKED